MSESFSTVIEAVVIVFGCLAFITAGIDNIKKLKKPVDDVKERLDSCDKRLANDNERLNDLEEIKPILLRGVKALVSHEINGNSIDKLEESYKEIDAYLINR